MLVSVMPDHRFREITQMEPMSTQAVGQFDVLPIHKNIFIVSADSFERAAAQQHASVCTPVCFASDRIIELWVLVRLLAQLPAGYIRLVRTRCSDDPRQGMRIEGQIGIRHQTIWRPARPDPCVVPCPKS